MAKIVAVVKTGASIFSFDVLVPNFRVSKNAKNAKLATQKPGLPFLKLDCLDLDEDAVNHFDDSTSCLLYRSKNESHLNVCNQCKVLKGFESS